MARYLFRQPHQPQTTRRSPQFVADLPLDLLCGAECRLSWDEGGALSNNHWQDRNGTGVATGTTTPHSGTYYYAITGPSSNLRTYAAHPTATVGYLQLWFRLSNVAPASASTIAVIENSGALLHVRVSATGVLELGFNGATFQTGPTLSTNTWYGIELEENLSTPTQTCRWRTNVAGTWTDQTDATRTGAVQTISNGYTIGTGSTWGAGDIVDYDDIRIGSGVAVGAFYGATARTYTSTARISPDSDGTHSFTTNDFTKTGVGVAPTDTTLWDVLDDSDMTSTADYIAQVVAGAGKYIEIHFGSASQTIIGQVESIAVVNISAAGSAEHHLRVSDNGTTWLNLQGDWAADGDTIATTSARSRSTVLRVAPSGVTWTQSLLNSLRVQWGNSDLVTQNPRLHSLAFEYEYEPGASLVERTWTEAVTTVDTWTRTLTANRTWTSAVTATDSWTRVASLVRSWSDVITTSDAWTRVGTFVRSWTSAVTTSDSWTRALTLARTWVSSVTTSDIWTRVATLLRSWADAVTTTDSWTQTKILVRSWAETVTSSDTWTRTATLARSWTSAVTASDSWVRVATFVRSWAESVATSDAWTQTKLIVRTWAEAITTSDVWTRTVSLARSWTEMLTTSDVWTRSGTLVRSWAESVTTTDTWARVATFVRSFTSAVTTSDVWVRTVDTLGVIGGFPPIAYARTLVARITEGTASTPKIEGTASTPKIEGE